MPQFVDFSLLSRKEPAQREGYLLFPAPPPTPSSGTPPPDLYYSLTEFPVPSRTSGKPPLTLTSPCSKGCVRLTTWSLGTKTHFCYIPRSFSPSPTKEHVPPTFCGSLTSGIFILRRALAFLIPSLQILFQIKSFSIRHPDTHIPILHSFPESPPDCSQTQTPRCHLFYLNL